MGYFRVQPEWVAVEVEGYMSWGEKTGEGRKEERSVMGDGLARKKGYLGVLAMG